MASILSRLHSEPEIQLSWHDQVWGEFCGNCKHRTAQALCTAERLASADDGKRDMYIFAPLDQIWCLWPFGKPRLVQSLHELQHSVVPQGSLKGWPQVSQPSHLHRRVGTLPRKMSRGELKWESTHLRVVPSTR